MGKSVGVFVVLWALPCFTSDLLLRFKDNPGFFFISYDKTSSTDFSTPLNLRTSDSEGGGGVGSVREGSEGEDVGKLNESSPLARIGVVCNTST